ncbi:MAG TPA: DUF2065 domain-containing protein [Steroidobacteraceae bacterium]|nr:DUF2065 domain-containing protein [Steroidobacteraceae bacterium]
MLWSDLLGAFALYLIIEGILPFLNPAALKRAMAAFLQLELRQLRVIGLVSMLCGLALLYFVRG